MRRGQRLPDAGIRVLVYFTGTVVCRPDLGGVGAVAVDGPAGSVRRLDGSETVVPALTAGTSYRLSQREIQVLTLVAGAMDNTKIARHLFLSLHTVKAHVKSILQKLDATNRADAVIKAIRVGILDISKLPVFDDRPCRSLSVRQQLILPLIAAGLTRAEIAERMELPEYVVANLELSFHRMWGGDTRHDIVTVALERGLLEDHRG